MKKTLIVSFALVATALSGCVSRQSGDESSTKTEFARYGEFVPKGELQPSAATAFAGYGAAMRHHDGYQMAYEWQQANPQAVKDATAPEVLKAFVESEEAAIALLAKIGTAYDGDPIVLTQIAAVTQLVMRPDCPQSCCKAPCRKKAKCRKTWVKALERVRATTDDGYVRTFCDQQLRLCVGR